MSYVNSVTVYPSSATITKGKWYYGAYASIASDCPECAEVEWYSNSPAIASVNKTTGYIYGVSTGTTRIYAIAKDDDSKKDYIEVTVTAPVSVTGVEVCPTNLTMNVGETECLSASITPSNATNQTVTWCSSNENVATVGLYTGKVTAKMAGTTTITATTADGGYSVSCTVKVFIDTVTIQKDGNFNKVVFNKSGKVWYCLNHDLIYDVVDEMRSTLTTRLMHNYCKKFVEGDPWDSDTNPKKYTDDEIRLLYAIDPYGVAAYVQKFAGEKECLEATIQEKDRVFELLFGRKPKYFARTSDNQWYETEDISDLSAVLSESENIFGMHTIWDENTISFKDVLCLITDVAITVIFKIPVLSSLYNKYKTVKTIVKIALFSISTIKDGLAAGIINSIEENALYGTEIDWAYKLVSVYSDIYDLVDSFNPELNYNRELIGYCANDLDYLVYAEMQDGQIHTLHNIYDSLIVQ